MRQQLKSQADVMELSFHEAMDQVEVIDLKVLLRVVEHLNGSNRPGEEARAEELISTYGYLGTGGSDAHLVSAIGSCLTRFDRAVTCDEDLVMELRGSDFSAVRLEETKGADL